VTPATGFESGFAAGVVEEGLEIPAQLDRDLGKQQPAGSASLDEYAVAAHDHILDSGWAEGRECGDFYPHMRELVESELWEAGIIEGSGESIVPYRPPQWRHADHVADAAAQTAADLESDERSSWLE